MLSISDFVGFFGVYQASVTGHEEMAWHGVDSTSPLANMKVSIRKSKASVRANGISWRFPTTSSIGKVQQSLDWFKGKFTGNHGFYHQI